MTTGVTSSELGEDPPDTPAPPEPQLTSHTELRTVWESSTVQAVFFLFGFGEVQNVPLQTKYSEDQTAAAAAAAAAALMCLWRTAPSVISLSLFFVLFSRTSCSYCCCNCGCIIGQIQSRWALLAQRGDWHHLGICGAGGVCVGGLYSPLFLH